MEIQDSGIFALAREYGFDWREALDFSEAVNPLGLAPGARDAIFAAMDRVPHFPERMPTALVEALARRWQMPPERILPGNGTTELLYFTARMWRKETASVAVPCSPDALRAYTLANEVSWNDTGKWPASGLVILANPNPVIGQTVARERLETYLLRTKNPVLVDESFIEFSDAKSMLSLIGERPNLFVLRSMSEFYALAGLRVGALVGDSGNLAALREKREPWQVNALAEAAALASLEDIEYAARTRALIAGERAWLWEQLSRIPAITPVRSEANFILIYLASGADELARFLARHKVLVRDCTGWPGLEGDAIRIAVRQRPENERFVSLLKRYISG